MRTDIVDAVDRTATALLRRTPTSPGMESGTRHAVVAAKDRILAELRQSPSQDWDGALADRLAKAMLGAFDPWGTDVPASRGKRDPFAATLALRCVRLAHDAVTCARTSDADAGVVDAVTGRPTRPRPPRVCRGASDEPVLVTVLHPWRRRTGSGKGPFGTISQPVALVHATESEAPVVAWLHAPDANSLGLRRWGDGYLRPVLSPGSWRPVTSSDFADAASHGWAWRDNPFLPRPHPVLAQAGLDVLCSPRVVPDERDEGDVAVLRATVGEVASRLRVIDDVVHVPTAAPEVTVLLRSSKDADDRVTRHWVLTWRFDDVVHGAADMATLPATRTSFSPPRLVHADVDGRPKLLRWGPSFALADVALVDAFLAAWDPLHLDQGWYGNHHVIQQTHGWASPNATRPYDVVVPSQLPSDPGRARALAAELGDLVPILRPSKGVTAPNALDPLGVAGMREALLAVAGGEPVRDVPKVAHHHDAAEPDLEDIVL